MAWLDMAFDCSGTIFGFPALFKILPKYGIYADSNNCLNTTEIGSEQSSCEEHQTRHYQVCLYIRSIDVL
jgi:hypothetical protein